MALVITQTSITTPDALAYCAQIVRQHAKSFYFCSHFLPLKKRLAMFAIYALCRTLDDIVDEAPSGQETKVQQELNTWRKRLDLLYSDEPVEEPILVAMRSVLAEYPVKKVLFEELIAGLEMDLYKQTYQTFEQLRLYCYRVASTVGLMGSEVFGYADASALPKAEALGIAMQLTNILRDVGEDLAMGRIYLPSDELAQFDYQVSDLKAGRLDPRFIRLMQFQVKRARQFYQEADAGIPLLQPDSRLTVLAASRLYGGILQAIEYNNYDVFTRRASLSLAAKLMRLPQIWLTRWLKFN